MPAYLIKAPIYSTCGWVHPTAYGWRFFPGQNVRKHLKAIREAGIKATRMACGTYRCEGAAL